MVDIYIRNEDDPNFKSDIIESNDELDMFKSQIEMVLTTNKTEVLGDYLFGGSFEELIHTFDFNENQIRTEVTRLISGYCTLCQKFSYDVKVKFYRGSVRDIGLVDIIIDGTKMFGILIT